MLGGLRLRDRCCRPRRGGSLCVVPVADHRESAASRRDTQRRENLAPGEGLAFVQRVSGRRSCCGHILRVRRTVLHGVPTFRSLLVSTSSTCPVNCLARVHRPVMTTLPCFIVVRSSSRVPPMRDGASYPRQWVFSANPQ